MSWRLIFAINLPIAALVVAVAWRHVPESRDAETTGRVDIRGGVLVTLGLIGITYGLIDGPSAGWASPAPHRGAARQNNRAGPDGPAVAVRARTSRSRS
ncbi:MAG TPA: hypothetical protein VMU94_12935 [Streptosporangiaceae bacterium]|nr:hypothetical protein [Streptosporangiaceae bacterium]